MLNHHSISLTFLLKIVYELCITLNPKGGPKIFVNYSKIDHIYSLKTKWKKRNQNSSDLLGSRYASISFSRERIISQSIGAAIAILEYVPTTAPNIIASINPRSVSGPKKKSTTKTIITVVDVQILRVNVSLTDRLISE